MSNSVNAHPLHWPENYPRTSRPKWDRFGVTFAVARDHLLNELRLFGAINIVISSNVPLRRDGLPYANQGTIEDAGVAVYFERHGKAMCIPCDEWHTVRANIRAIGKTVEAIRGVERWGTKAMVEAAISGFAAIPETTGGEAWWDVLGLDPGATRDDIERQYRHLARMSHPDMGGMHTDGAVWLRVQAAYEQAKAVAA